MTKGSSYGATNSDGEFVDFDEVESVHFEHKRGQAVALVCHMLSGRDHRIEGAGPDLVRLRDGIFRRQERTNARPQRLPPVAVPVPDPTLRETIEEARALLKAGKVAHADTLLNRALRKLP